MTIEWIWFIFVFAIGACIGSFLNVVIYRLPRDKSLVTPPSACPACDKRIHFYDNIPLLSWLALRGKCRYCKARISPRYFVIELLTAMIFSGVFLLYFLTDIRRFDINGVVGFERFIEGGWFFYLVHVILFAGLVAASAIDLELWVIPLSICWFVTAVGLIASSVSGFIIDPAVIWSYELFPSTSAKFGVITAGAGAGLIVSLVLLSAGVIKRSYGSDQADGDISTELELQEPVGGHRREVMKEVVFLLPIIAGGAAAFCINKYISTAGNWWANFSQLPVVTGFLGSLCGYFAGCGIIWLTRILGTLGFGKEAMGLGDVHLMGAAGTVIGPVFVIIAFFVAPFFGLGWAGYQTFFKKTREIPYGPFLSLAVFAVIIFHDWFRVFLSSLYLYR